MGETRARVKINTARIKDNHLELFLSLILVGAYRVGADIGTEFVGGISQPGIVDNARLTNLWSSAA